MTELFQAALAECSEECLTLRARLTKLEAAARGLEKFCHAEAEVSGDEKFPPMFFSELQILSTALEDSDDAD